MPYFDADCNELDPASVQMPRMWTLCDKKDDSDADIFCNLTRLDQRDATEFRCAAFVSLYGALIDDIIK